MHEMHMTTSLALVGNRSAKHRLNGNVPQKKCTGAVPCIVSLPHLFCTGALHRTLSVPRLFFMLHCFNMTEMFMSSLVCQNANSKTRVRWRQMCNQNMNDLVDGNVETEA